MREVGGDAKILPAGQLTIDGRKVICGRRPTVLNSKLDDYGSAYPGFVILNPKVHGHHQVDGREAMDPRP